MSSEQHDIGDLFVFNQAVGVMVARRCTSVEDAEDGLIATAAMLGVSRHALARLVVEAVNKRGRSRFRT